MIILRGTHHILDEHPELLTDESSLSGGNCQVAAWPGDRNESRSFLRECYEDTVPVTVSGARTGITGGAVPMGGAVLSTEHLKGIERTSHQNIIRVMAGETIEDVGEYCRKNLPGFYYPPDPTETTASIGGTVATDASGASSYRYGSTRRWIKRVSIILPSGTELTLTRGDHVFRHGRLIHPVLGPLELPELEKPQPPKNAAGLFIAPDMDLIDLFIGSEGRLGLILDADLILHKKPHAVASLAIFCEEEQFWQLRDDLMASILPVREVEAMVPPCLEFLDRNAVLPVHPEGPWVLITSIEASSEKDLDRILETLDVMLGDRGISPANTWGGFDEIERSKLREFRHLLPETVNRLIAGISSRNSQIHKISTDTAVPPAMLRAYHEHMNRILVETGVEHVVFGHCGQGHLHANLIPLDSAELELAERAVELMAAKAVYLGGTISAEHGTGKLKKPLLNLMYSQKELEQMDLLINRIYAC